MTVEPPRCHRNANCSDIVLSIDSNGNNGQNFAICSCTEKNTIIDDSTISGCNCDYKQGFTYDNGNCSPCNDGLIDAT